MGSNTTNLSLYKPDEGEDGWASQFNNNFDTIDTLVTRATDIEIAHEYGGDLAAIQSAVDALPSGGGVVWISKQSGPYPADADVLSLPSDVTLLSDNATISAGSKDVTGGDTLVVENADGTNGNDNIRIENLRIEGKLDIGASSGTCEDILLRSVECFGVSDFAFDLSQLRDFSIVDCHTDNDGIGMADNGNDGIHLIDVSDGEVRGFSATSGDDILALEASNDVVENVYISGLRGSSAVGDLIKLFTNSGSSAGDDIRNVTVNGARTTGLNNGDVIEFECDGSGEIYDCVFSGVHASDPDGTNNIRRGIVTNDTTAVHDITFQSCHIEDVQERVAQFGDGWEAHGCHFRNGGLEGSNYVGVTLTGDESKLIGGTVGPTTLHVVQPAGANCIVRDVTIDATGGSDLGVRVTGADARILENTIDATNSFAIGADGNEGDTLVRGNNCLSNAIGSGQFEGGALFQNNVPSVTRDLSTLTTSTLRDGESYKHNGNSALTADTDVGQGVYVWSNTDSEFKNVVDF